METIEHPLTTWIDKLHRKAGNRRSIPEVLDAVLEVYDCFARERGITVPITSSTAVPGNLVEFHCEVRSVVRSQIAAYLNPGGGLLLFRPESISDECKRSWKVDVVSLGCVVRDHDSRIQTPVVVKIFNEHRDIRKGHQIKVIGILTYVPVFRELILSRGDNPILSMLDHDESDPDPPGARRVHAMFYDRFVPIVEEIPEEIPLTTGGAWCVLQ